MHLHHLHISCRNLNLAKLKLTQIYRFQEYGKIPTKHVTHDVTFNCDSVVLKLSSIYVVLTERSDLLCDTIDDVTFSVDSIEECCVNAASVNSDVIVKPVYIDEHGNETNKSGTNVAMAKAVIKSPVGNVLHTIISKQKKMDFLPGFKRINLKNSTNIEGQIKYLDHIAFAVDNNTTEEYMKWYDTVFHLQRFYSNNTEPINGLIVRSTGGNGLRMLTLTGHPCNNMGVLANETEMGNDHIKFVFAESLTSSGTDQIRTFMKNHGQAGVQHIAFYTNSILDDANLWLKNGVSFIKPPKAYYKEISDTLSALSVNTDVDAMADVGVLIDCENKKENTGYLYQIFTRCILESDTFFFELIQRDNAKGFGVGNISALWRALENHVQSSS